MCHPVASSSAEHLCVRTIVLIAAWLATGSVAAVIFVLLIALLLVPRHSAPAPGDGILIMLLVMIFVPAGAILVCMRAVAILKGKRFPV
jgi:hypothetical protein